MLRSRLREDRNSFIFIQNVEIQKFAIWRPPDVAQSFLAQITMPIVHQPRNSTLDSATQISSQYWRPFISIFCHIFTAHAQLFPSFLSKFWHRCSIQRPRFSKRYQVATMMCIFGADYIKVVEDTVCDKNVVQRLWFLAITYGDIRRGYRERAHCREAPARFTSTSRLWRVWKSVYDLDLIEIGLSALYGVGVKPWF